MKGIFLKLIIKLEEEIPNAIVYDADKELNSFLKDADLENKLVAFDKSYIGRCRKDTLPLLIYVAILIFSWLALFYNWVHLNAYINDIIMLLILAVGYVIALLFHFRLKPKLNRNLSTSINELSEAVQNVLEYASDLNPEYLSCLLGCRIRERQRLDEQFNEMMKIISNVIKFPLFLGVIVQGIYIHTLKSISSLPQSIITLDVAVIAIVIILGLVINYINSRFFDIYYYRLQTMLNAVNKFKIETWKNKPDC